MNIERVTDIGRRVALHSALADPTRLRIVDALSIGDAAPSELADHLQIASNLLAHHLKLLEGAGVVRRFKSEGDGRRSYWRLVPHAFEDMTPPRLTAPERVVFVCSANSARSHLAAALWREASDVPVASAGTHPAERINPGAAATARRGGLDLPDVAPRHLSDVLPSGAAGPGDLVVTVCDRAHEELGACSQVHWSVPDPVGPGTDDAFDRARDELAARVRHLAPLLDTAL